jgi:hypothetical protein
MDREGIKDALRAQGIEIEPREPTPVENLVASGLGSLGGQLVAKVLRFGWLGTGIAGVAGGALGLIAVRYRARWRPDQARPGAFEGERV